MSGRRSGLGRGLEALIPQAEAIPSHGFALIPLDEIRPNPQQPRSRIDEEALEGLAASIAEVGVLQPVVVRPQPDQPGFTLIAGERRWRAARKVGLREIPAMIRTADDQGSLTEALIENVQREDLSPLEEAAAYQQLLEDFGMTHEEVASRVGKSRAAVTNTLRLLQLPATIQGLLERGELTAGHARPLLGLEDRKYAEHIASQAAGEGWSVRQVEEAVRARKAADEAPPPRPKLREVRPVAIIELEQRLSERLGTPVRIQYRNRRGRVSIRFASLEELERIYRTFFG